MTELDYGVISADCRDLAAVEKLLGGRKVNVVVTSPPYASQRTYDASSGFKPIPPDQYVAWFKDVAAVIERILALDGSYFLNIKAHAEDGERSLYVIDLALAHKREWGWRLVDEFCWRNTANGVPGGWPNRFKNAWEPIFHFCRRSAIKFRPDTVSHHSERCLDYDPSGLTAHSGSGLHSYKPNQERSGLARPSNVIELARETGQGAHSAPYPVALAEFFIKAFSDPGDVIFDPFMGSGTTMIASMRNGRSCFGCEISPAYTDVIVRRAQEYSKSEFLLAEDGRTFAELSAERIPAAAAGA